MYTRSSTFVSSNSASPDLFIENDDYSNSELLYQLDHYTEFSTYIITKYEYRIDLISNDIYKDEKYGWILLYINRISVDDLTVGSSLKFITLSNLTTIINAL